MKLRHYATISTTGKGFFPHAQTFNLPSNSIDDIQIPENAIKIITFDRLIGNVEYEDTKYPVATKAIHKKVYHIGKFQEIGSYLDKGNFYQALAQNGAIGMVITRDGKDNVVYKNETVLDPKYITKEGFYVKTQQKEASPAKRGQQSEQNRTL